MEQDTTFTSASVAKLKSSKDDEIIMENNNGYCIPEFFSVFTASSALIVCAECKKYFIFSWTAPRGLRFKIALQCSCDGVQYINSSPFINKAFEINRRIVVVMRL